MVFLEEMRDALANLKRAARLAEEPTVVDLVESASTLAAAAILLNEKLAVARLLCAPAHVLNGARVLNAS